MMEVSVQSRDSRGGKKKCSEREENLRPAGSAELYYIWLYAYQKAVSKNAI